MSGRSPSRKVALGQFYTPELIADFMVGLSDVPPDARVLEPSCGPGAFLAALARAGYRDIHGCDIDPANVATATALMGDQAVVDCADFLSLPADGGYDLVIGNPPYVRWNRIPAEQRWRLSTDPFWSDLANGQWDLLFAFLVWSVSQLREGGQMVFIVPTNWMRSTHAASLRHYLADNGRFETILHFGEFRLFSDCYPNCVILTYRKGVSAGDRPIVVADFVGRRGEVRAILAAITDPLNTTRKGIALGEQVVGDWHLFTVPAFRPDDTWYLAPEPARRAVDAIEALCGVTRLGDVADVAVGLVSGRDRVFRLSEDDLARIPVSERGLLVRHFVKAAHCRRYRSEGGAPMLFPHGLSQVRIEAEAPWSWEYLLRQRADLEERYLARGADWFDWATVRNLELLESHRGDGKIFVPCIDRSPRARFSYSDTNVLAGGDVLVVVPRPTTREDTRYVLAWLNCRRVGLWYRTKGARNGQRTLYTQPYVSRIPFLEINWQSESESAAYERILDLVTQRLSEADPEHGERLEVLIEDQFDAIVAERSICADSGVI